MNELQPLAYLHMKCKEIAYVEKKREKKTEKIYPSHMICTKATNVYDEISIFLMHTAAIITILYSFARCS